ncbi:MAG: metallophosphoesterase [Oscillospiraceae bacterium]|nr:metallophosphoesterase [Oscillospiraceae bacterium]
MLYAVSDIHGCYELWRKFLDEIKFSADKDRIYVLGDFIDRGNGSVRLLKEMKDMDGVTVLAGNHERMFSRAYRMRFRKINSCSDIALYKRYLADGGEETINEFFKLDMDEKIALLDWIDGLPLYKELDVNGRKLVLVHGGIGNFAADKKLSEYTEKELTKYRVSDDDRFYDDRILICGHTPTLKEDGSAAEIIKRRDYINIDCGCLWREKGGRLAYLELEELRANYII